MSYFGSGHFPASKEVHRALAGPVALFFMLEAAWLQHAGMQVLNSMLKSI